MRRSGLVEKHVAGGGAHIDNNVGESALLHFFEVGEDVFLAVGKTLKITSGIDPHEAGLLHGLGRVGLGIGGIGLGPVHNVIIFFAASGR